MEAARGVKTGCSDGYTCEFHFSVIIIIIIALLRNTLADPSNIEAARGVKTGCSEGYTCGCCYSSSVVKQ